MPGFEIQDPELLKLFAEAEGAVLKVQHRAPAATPVVEVSQPDVEVSAAPAHPATPAVAPPLVAAAEPQAPSPPPPPVAAPVAPPVAAAPRNAEPRRLAGGEQTADGLTARAADGETVMVPWSHIRSLTLGRVGDRQWLGFSCQGSQYYFSDDGVVYKGLLKSLQSTTAMNWRGLVAEIAEHVTDKSDAGVAVILGEAGTIPRFQDKASYWASVKP